MSEIDARVREMHPDVLRHLSIVAETGPPRDVWLDGDQVIRVLVPQDEFEAVRAFAADPSPTDQGGLDEL